MQLDQIANNLANSSTNGYKSTHAVFEDLMYQTLRQAGANSSEQTQLPSGLQVGLGVQPVASERQFTQGNLQQTGNSLDLAIQGNGFFQIQLPDGTTGYTRDGSFQVDSQGRMVTNSGYVVQPGITIPANASTVTIAKDGTVTAAIPGQTSPQNLGQIQLATFVNPGGLDAQGGNIYLETAASGSPNVGAPQSSGFGALSQGFVETSNVNVVAELVQMIQTQRTYELNSKAIQTSDQMLQNLGQL